MPPADRGAITNAIWLCSNCHKMIDDDEIRFPAGLLFEWQRNHAQRIAEQIGKAGAELRLRYEKRHLEEFGRLSYLAERLIVEKDDLWEYRLTGETLRFEMAPILRRWEALKSGLYINTTNRVSNREFFLWISDRMKEAEKIGAAFTQLMNHEFKRAWGDPGVPGDDIQIVSTCRFFAEMCLSALKWEEQVRFVCAQDVFDDVIELLKGVMGGIIDEAAKVPKFMAETFGSHTSSGTYSLNLELSLPEGWFDQISAALDRATGQVMAEIEAGEVFH
jgi:hypothetical protein